MNHQPDQVAGRATLATTGLAPAALWIAVTLIVLFAPPVTQHGIGHRSLE